MRDSFNEWENVYKNYNKNDEGYLWPSETLIRLLKGEYIANIDKNYKGKKVLDIGFGNGNNLVLLSSLQMKTYGIEVTEEICEIVKNKLKKIGHEVNLKSGTNQNIPFPNEFFDYIVSWNVIHYEKSENDIQKALKEYSRVLKQGGRFLISTTGPESKILKNSIKLENHRYKIGREDDFRKGEIFYYFDDKNNIKENFKKQFKNVKIGRTLNRLIDNTIDYFIITGLK